MQQNLVVIISSANTASRGQTNGALPKPIADNGKQMINNLLTKNSRPNSNQELRKQFGFEAIVIFFGGGRL